MTQTFAAQLTTLPQRFVLPNGIVVLILPNLTTDIIAARLFLRSGSCWETAQTAGLLNLMASLLTKGTTELSSMEIAERVEFVGAGLGTDAATDYLLLSLKSVSADFPDLLTLAAQILRSPSFPESELELERRLTLQSLRAQQEHPLSVAFDLLRQALYPDHPYALSSLGTEASLAQLAQADLFEYHQRHFRPDNLVISIAGCIDPEITLNKVAATFGDWQAPAEPLPQLDLVPPQFSPRQVQLAQATHQLVLMLGYLGPSVHETLYPAMKLLSTYLGNGMSSRLFVELREKRGLAYEVSTFYPTRLHAAPFGAYLGTAPDNAVIAREQLQHELDILSHTRLSPNDLQTTKNKLLGQYALGKQTNAQLAQLFGWYETLGLGLGFDQIFQAQIAEVNLDDLQLAAQTYLAEPTLAAVGPDTALAGLGLAGLGL